MTVPLFRCTNQRRYSYNRRYAIVDREETGVFTIGKYDVALNKDHYLLDTKVEYIIN